MSFSSIDINNRFHMDVPCIQCGYTLYDPVEESVCPECGTPVSDSLRLRGKLSPKRFAKRTLQLFVINGLALYTPGMLFVVFMDQHADMATVLQDVLVVPFLFICMALAVMVELPESVVVWGAGIAGIVILMISTWYCLYRAEHPLLFSIRLCVLFVLNSVALTLWAIAMWSSS